MDDFEEIRNLVRTEHTEVAVTCELKNDKRYIRWNLIAAIAGIILSLGIVGSMVTFAISTASRLSGVEQGREYRDYRMRMIEVEQDSCKAFRERLKYFEVKQDVLLKMVDTLLRR